MAQQIAAHEQNPLPTIVSTPSLPPELRLWIDRRAAVDENGGQLPEGWHHPTSIPAAVRSALPAVLEAFEESLIPAGRNFLIAHLTRLAILFPGTKPEAQWRIVFEDMAEDLAEFSPDIILEAIRRHRRSSRFFPQISELFSVCAGLRAVRQAEIDRMCRLLRIETHEELATRKQREAERKAAEWKAILAVRPDLRIKERWRSRFNFCWKQDYSKFLDFGLAKFDEATVDRWHEVAAAEGLNDEEALARLRQQYREALAGIDGASADR